MTLPTDDYIKYMVNKLYNKMVELGYIKMKTNDAGLKIISKFEGYSLKPYICPAGYLTVGYGHRTDSYEEITDNQALTYLQNDVSIAERGINKLVKVSLNSNEFSALASFVFNLGAGRLQASTLRSKLNRGDYDGAAREFQKWVYANGKKLNGLIARRLAEELLFRS